MKIDRVVFREYDIRGVIGENIDSDFALNLGKAFGTCLAGKGLKSVAVAGDNRKTTPDFKKNILKGLIETGRNVCDAGITPTPVLYFGRKTGNYDAGVMVTASHNPPRFNGFKLSVGDSSLYGSQIQEIADIMERGSYASGTGRHEAKSFDEEYVEYMKSRFSFSRGLRIGVDTGNGTTGPLVERLFDALGIKYKGIYLESDSSFPNHMPDPVVPENMADLVSLVRERKLDAGFGFDGDGDRIGVIGSDGSILWGDQLLIIYSADLLAKKPGATVVYDVKCTRALGEEIKKNGGIPVMWKTGHSLIENKMHETHGYLAGELSGHMYFADEYFGFDDAFYAALRLLRIMDETGRKPEELLAGVKQYYASPEIRTDVGEEKKYEIVENLKKYYKARFDVSEIDGVKVYFPDGWALARVSNTQPAIVLRVEGDTKESMGRIRKEFIGKVEEFTKQ